MEKTKIINPGELKSSIKEEVGKPYRKAEDKISELIKSKEPSIPPIIPSRPRSRKVPREEEIGD